MNINEFLKKFGSMVNEKELTDRQIWHKAKSGDPSILSDPRVSTLKDENDNTILHYLASRGVKEVLKHPDVSKVRDEFGWTPLHLLVSWSGPKEAWFHPDFDKVKDGKGRTPKDRWIYAGHKQMTCTDFVK